MTTPHLTLCHFPGACSRVSLCALEMAGLPYELKLINVAKGEQTSADYMAVSALGKVPALIVDGEPLLENSAIITFAHALRPEAGIFPLGADPLTQAEAVGGLSFCSGALHPLVRGVVNPQRITTGDGEPVRERSRELVGKAFAYAEARIAQRGWWLGEISIVDVYLDWAFWVVRKGAFDPEPYPNLIAMADRLRAALPAYEHMLAVEVRSSAELGL